VTQGAGIFTYIWVTFGVNNWIDIPQIKHKYPDISGYIGKYPMVGKDPMVDKYSTNNYSQ